MALQLQGIALPPLLLLQGMGVLGSGSTWGEGSDYKGVHALPSGIYKGWPSSYKGLPSLPF